MTTTHEAVLEAVFTLVKGALATAQPLAKVVRNGKPERLEPGGLVVMWDGDPGEPEMDLSPPVYNFQRRILLGFGAAGGAGRPADQVTADLKAAVNAAVRGDRHLGGLCDWLETAPADPQALTEMGVDVGDLELGGVDAHYATADAL